MAHDSSIGTASDDLLWNLVGVVELSYHPLFAVAVLAAAQVAVSPMPHVVLDPLTVAFTGRGIPITTFFAGIVLADLASDAVGVYGSGWLGPPREGG